MARIRKVEISNFRCIKQLTWLPDSGVNCLIGPGDTGKSTILDAIDLCLGARRSLQLTDADFYRLDVENPISITLTIGDLDDALKNIDSYGLYLRGFDPATGTVEDEPEKDHEVVLTLSLTVEGDLEPEWCLVSDRARTQNSARGLVWSDRVRLSPTRIGALAQANLGWRRGSVLNRLTDEKADATAALTKAARDARAAFGDDADSQLSSTLTMVQDTAKDLGVAVGTRVRAMLDTHSVSFSGGTISLHTDEGVPLEGLGTGSTRLLIAGLQRKAAATASIVLADELEYGLEPHRIMRFLDSLGAKETQPPLQVFMTTHSPVALRELSGDQLLIVREVAGEHQIMRLGSESDVQSAVRLYPEAFLSRTVLVCEGASEIGFVRGIDQWAYANGYGSIAASGVALVDCGGGDADKPYTRALAFQRLGYRVGVLRDDDKKPSAEIERQFKDCGGAVFHWTNARALEDELFLNLPISAVGRLIDYAEQQHGDQQVDSQLRSESSNRVNLASVRHDLEMDALSLETRAFIAKASRKRRAGWFKSITWMEEIAREIVGDALESSSGELRNIVFDAFGWMHNA
ncbi:ATP-dependent nuclease [Microvirga roseola]|uniref:ATP-dependent nuclease n=1 Tax=Microvirga roseola TaxID=2883126 RepID=UPI001E51CB1B|nr:ATP-binding protein [Microvirga roseola]